MEFMYNGKKEFNMFKEMLEQKDVFKALCNKFFDANYNLILDEFPMDKYGRIIICASGSSNNAGEIAKYFIESIAKVPCCVEFASEYAHKENVLNKDDLFVAISQSGNTADTFEALMRAKRAGATTFAITNDKTSKIHTNADYKVLADAGVEASIAATKSFTAQLLILYVFAIALAEKNNGTDLLQFKKEFVALADKYDDIFNQKEAISKIAPTMAKSESVAILGRHINYALAKEGCLKTKETSYINANTMPAGEFMHGHFAFLDEKVPVIAILTKADGDEENYKLAIHNIQEVQSKRNINVILLRTVGDEEIKNQLKVAYTIDIPKVNKWLAPFLSLVALQINAYETAKLVNEDVDNPRDLVKCVAAE